MRTHKEYLAEQLCDKEFAKRYRCEKKKQAAMINHIPINIHGPRLRDERTTKALLQTGNYEEIRAIAEGCMAVLREMHPGPVELCWAEGQGSIEITLRQRRSRDE